MGMLALHIKILPALEIRYYKQVNPMPQSVADLALGAPCVTGPQHATPLSIHTQLYTKPYAMFLGTTKVF